MLNLHTRCKLFDQIRDIILPLQHLHLVMYLHSQVEDEVSLDGESDVKDCGDVIGGFILKES